MQRRRLKIWALGFGFYGLVAVLFAIQKVALYAARGETVGASGILLTFTGIYTWAALTPAIVWVSRRYPLGRERRARNVAVHLFAAVLIISIDIGVYALLDFYLFQALAWSPDRAALAIRFLRLLAWGSAGDLLWYGAVVAATHAMTYRELVRDRDLAASRVEARLSAARLQVLKTQLQPHFLFNTLHAVSAMLHDQPTAAKRMIARLRELLRLTLEEDARQKVPLEKELRLLKVYLAIQTARFRGRLRVRWDVETRALEALVPPLILQPIVENAVRHGISRRARRGRIELQARCRDGILELAVRDNGDGVPAGRRALREGVGLANTRARLAQLYGAEGTLELSNAPGGFTVMLRFPVGPPGPARQAREETRAPLPDDVPPRRADPWRVWRVSFAAWGVFGLVLMGYSVFLTAPQGEPLYVERFLVLACHSAAWALYTILILQVCARFPLGRPAVWRALAVHVAANGALFFTDTAFLVALDEAIGWVRWESPLPTTVVEKFRRGLLAGFADGMTRYWLVVGIGHALTYRRVFAAREVAAAALEARLASTEVQLLTMQLQPRFLFETLEAIAERIPTDPRGADQMLARLSDVLRSVLENEGRQEVSLRDELAALDPYLRIQEIRRREGLAVRRSVDPEALGARVPHLVLQPLVDHVLRRVTAFDGGLVTLDIGARREDGRLLVEVRGEIERRAAGVRLASGSAPAAVGRAPAGAAALRAGPALRHEGSSLGNTDLRLRQLYGPEHRLDLMDEEQAPRVALEIPFRAGA